jgi:hypothetical protein
MQITLQETQTGARFLQIKKLKKETRYRRSEITVLITNQKTTRMRKLSAVKAEGVYDLYRHYFFIIR